MSRKIKMSDVLYFTVQTSIVFCVLYLFEQNQELKKQNQMCATEAAEMVWRGCVLTYEKGEAVCEIVKP